MPLIKRSVVSHPSTNPSSVRHLIRTPYPRPAPPGLRPNNLRKLHLPGQSRQIAGGALAVGHGRAGGLRPPAAAELARGHGRGADRVRGHQAAQL